MAVSDKPVYVEPANAGDDNTEPEIELVAKQKTIAPVWKHLGFEVDEKGKLQSLDHSKCHVCQQEVAAKDGNTTNLYSHLKNRHHDLYLQVERGQARASMIIQQVSHHYQRCVKDADTSAQFLIFSNIVISCVVIYHGVEKVIS